MTTPLTPTDARAARPPAIIGGASQYRADGAAVGTPPHHPLPQVDYWYEIAWEPAITLALQRRCAVHNLWSYLTYQRGVLLITDQEM
jgi:hypothetical protein